MTRWLSGWLSTLAPRFGGAMVTLALLILLAGTHPAFAARRPVVPAAGAPVLNGNFTAPAWQAAAPASRLAYCAEALAAFRGSPAQSYIISYDVQSLDAQGLCDRIDQFYSLEENQDQRLSTAAALAPLLFADTPKERRFDGSIRRP
ncbi:MAG: hypothetical protein ACUVSQ_01795 [Pseudanabaenaceae cyanobacterium]